MSLTARVMAAAVTALAVSAVGLPAASRVFAATAPGGLIEHATDAATRPPLTAAQIQAFLPAERGPFTFPAPYNTRGARLTGPADCGGQACVLDVGYSYWRRINNHAGSDTMLIVLGLDPRAGGGGPTLFRYDKVTEAVTKVGPLFAPGTLFAENTAETWYWSARRPTAIYVGSASRLLRYDVVARTFETVFDVAQRPDLLGANRWIFQAHSSDDDRVHSATLLDSVTYRRLGCVVYREDTGAFTFFPATGTFKECHVDKSGRWLLTFDTVGETASNVSIDLQTGRQRTVLDRAPGGIVGHYDTGHGYVVGYDRWSGRPGTYRLWRFDSEPTAPYAWGPGLQTFRSSSWTFQVPDHVSWGHAQPDSVTPVHKQYVCGSGATTGVVPQGNEIICWRLDASLAVLVVAPVMTDLNAAGGGVNRYNKFPKGNLDVTGRYFVWTSNLGGSRLDAFIVKVPAELLAAAPAAPPAARALALPHVGRSTLAGVAAILVIAGLVAVRVGRRGAAQPAG